MRGSIRDKGNGRWELRAYAGQDPVTKRDRQRSRTIKGTRRKAEDEMRKFLREIEQEASVTTRGTVGYVVDYYLQHLEMQGASPTSLRTFDSYVRNHIRPVLGDLRVSDLKVETLDDFYRSRLAAGLASASVRQLHTILSGAFNLAVELDWMPSAITRRSHPPKVPSKDASAPTAEQVNRLLRMAVERDPVMAALIFVAATTGARRGELCALRWSNVNVEARTLTIAGNIVPVKGGRHVLRQPKTGEGGRRRVALDPATMDALVALAARQAEGGTLVADPFVFSPDLSGARPARPDGVTRFFVRLRDDAGLPNVRLHDLRHFMATSALGSGVDVRTVAGRGGWSNANVLLKTYAHFLPERDRQAADHIGALLSDHGSPLTQG